jgi:threonine/homoserine/homoserine lactone efflux protein
MVESPERGCNYTVSVSWSAYGEFLAFALVLIVLPGPDFAVVTKNTLVGGRSRGRWTSLGVVASAAVQGTAAAAGLSAIILRAEPLFQTIKWAGVCYLAFLGFQAFRSAKRGEYLPIDSEPDSGSTSSRWRGWRQGFLSNITNPKVLIFYLAVLPQFLKPGASALWILAFAWSHALLTLLYLLALTTGLHGARKVLQRRRVRRALDLTTGSVLLGFSAKLVTEHV